MHLKSQLGEGGGTAQPPFLQSMLYHYLMLTSQANALNSSPCMSCDRMYQDKKYISSTTTANVSCRCGPWIHSKWVSLLQNTPLLSTCRNKEQTSRHPYQHSGYERVYYFPPSHLHLARPKMKHLCLTENMSIYSDWLNHLHYFKPSHGHDASRKSGGKTPCELCTHNFLIQKLSVLMFWPLVTSWDGMIGSFLWESLHLWQIPYPSIHFFCLINHTTL